MATSSISVEEAKNILKKIREEQVRDGEMVIKLWEDVLVDSVHKLGNDLWNIYEQVCVASLDCQRLDLADMCIEALDCKFPNSMRVRRLAGMMLEAEGRYDTAQGIYQDISEKDNANMFARKRLVAILKAQRKIPDAIDKLNDYLKKFMMDYEAWNELCDLYLSIHDYSNAAFCMEELIMSNPHHHLYHQKYADIKYTLGGPENLELARSYYAQAVKLSPGNMRALYGLLLASTTLGKGSKDKVLNSKCAAWAIEQITTKYKSLQSEQQMRETKVLDSIEKLLETMQASG